MSEKRIVLNQEDVNKITNLLQNIINIGTLPAHGITAPALRSIALQDYVSQIHDILTTNIKEVSL